MVSKSVLVFIYDNVEGRILTSGAFLESLKNQYDEIYIAPLAGRDYFDELKINHLAHYYEAEFIKLDVSKFMFKIGMIYYHFCRIFKSESSRQKFLELCGFPPSYYFNYKSLEWLYPFARFAKRFEKKGHKVIGDSKQSKFNAILFPRPDSSYNYSLYKKFVSSKTKTIVLCRNFDTPTIKGIYTHQFDETLYFDPIIRDLIQEYIDTKESGYLNQIPYYINGYCFCPSKVFRIIFAVSQDRFVQNQLSQFEVIDYLLELLKGTDFLLEIRVHFEERHKFDRYLNFENVKLINDSSTEFINGKGYKVNMYSKEDVNNYIEGLGSANLLMTHSSTIVYDAYRLNTRSYFIDMSTSSRVLDREHLIHLKRYTSGTIKSKNELREVIIKEISSFKKWHET